MGSPVLQQYLRNDVGVGEAHHQAVLWRVVLVAVLHAQRAAGKVVGLPGASAAVLDLEPLKVRLVLDDLAERHG